MVETLRGKSRMKRRHKMPFGAEYGDESVRFRLWAPAARQVQVCFGDHNQSQSLTLDHCERGWFEITTEKAKAGTQYSFQIDGGQQVPDPASRFQPCDVHGPSEIIDPTAFEWLDCDWRGRRWEEAVLYELHVGAFTPAGTFLSACERLDHLAELGVTAVELMPVGDFPGRRNWGYDGVLPFAPDSNYGRPNDLKEFVQCAHHRGIMVLLDVVYNHFGPEGNYLNLYAPQFFTERHKTPWGKGINFDGPESCTVRDFFIQNALYWLTEYNFDGLRLDAVHEIIDDSNPHILTELAEVIRSTVDVERQIHLILENDHNQSRYLRRAEQCRPRLYTAQWNDDIHHVLHVLITGERDGYYSDYAQQPLAQLGQCLVEGFAYQGEKSLHRKGEPRGEATAGLPLTAFVSFLQNHDQVGNRAFGERITTDAEPQAVRAAVATLLLAPSPPLLFMGEEFGTETPFPFFCDFEKDLAAAVTAGRRNEFARFTRFSDPASREGIPDPNAVATFEASVLDWNELGDSSHQEWLYFYRNLLALRREYVVPRLSRACRIEATYELHGNGGIRTNYEFPDGSKFTLLANLTKTSISGWTALSATSPAAQVIYGSDGVNPDALRLETMPAWSVIWLLEA
jgi:maltooligosyltrehalose trehalohydrolase